MNIKEEKKISLQEVLDNMEEALGNMENDFDCFSVYTKKIGLKEMIKKTQEVQFGVNLTPKKELKTKKEFIEALENIEKSLEFFNLDYEQVDEDDDFQIEIIESNNNAIDEINSFFSEIRGKLRLIEYLY